jgi:glycosyltransferase involved in cell wall biosynthesis
MVKISKTPKVVLIRSRNTDPAIRKVAHALHQEGYDVTLLIWERNSKNSTSLDYSEYTTEYFCFSAPQDKLLAVLYFPIWWVYELFYLLRMKPDIIHACDLDTLYPAIISKILRKQSLVYSIYDFYANNLPNGVLQPIRSMVRYFVASIEKFGIRFSDLLILVDELRFEEVNGAKVKDLIYLYNTPDDIYEHKTLYSIKTSKNESIIFYAGIISYVRGISDIIAAVEDIENVKLILAGPLVDKTILNNASEKTQYIGWIPTYDELISKTSQADILFRFSDPDHPKTKFESPNKLFEAMMCGKPIIVSDQSSMANIVRQEECGFVVPYGDIDAIKRAILTLKNDPVLCKRLGENGRKAYETKYNWKIMEERLLKVYEKLDPE